MNIKQVVEHTVNVTIIKLKKQNLLQNRKLNSFARTEKLLYTYKDIKENKNGEFTKKALDQIDKALEKMQGEKYFDLIRLKYLEGKTHEQIAEYFECDTSTITRQRNKLIKKLSMILFSDEVLQELMLG